jgi:hypothetical protein
MLDAAAEAFRPKPRRDKKDDEIAALKAQLADLQAKIEKLG